MRKFDITIVGEFNLDLLLYGLPEELPVERELLANHAAIVLGGSPAITAHNLGALGNRVGFITILANDVFSPQCRRELENAGVDVSRAIFADHHISTGFTVLLQHNGTRRMLTYPGTAPHLTFDQLDLDYLCSARHFHLASYFLQTSLRSDVPRLFARLKEAGLTISLDTNDDPSDTWDDSIREVLRHVHVLLPNEYEACRMAHTENIDEAIEWLLQFVPLIVVKKGAEGAIACTRKRRWTASAVKVLPIDAVGAGDSFNAGFLHGYIRGWAMEDCLRQGNLAGAVSTTMVGGVAAFQSRAGLEQFFAEHSAEVK
ncbi:MAG TPA: carbohydrate kinase family protein [Pseudacidobacterium sp.]|jgi:sugar/nucleoside kinase (ribokinase family)|nr:carbohydrate kinase family protein [Pseudacidobacterium sp.]